MITGQKDRRSASDIARDRAARRDLIPALVAFFVTQGSLIVLDPDASTNLWTLAWSLSPLIAIAMLVRGQLRILQRCDERERLDQLGAMAIGFGVFAVALATVGVLQAADIGDPTQQTQVTFIVGIIAWCAALGLLQRRSS